MGTQLERNFDPDGTAAALKAILRRIAYPIHLTAVVVIATAAVRCQWDLGPTSLFFLLGTIAYLAALEHVIPYEPSWNSNRREWGLFGVYFVLTAIAGALAQLPTLTLVSAIAVPEPTLPMWVEVPLALLLGSLGSYVVHRLGHRNAFLWRFHGVHHVPQKVNVASNGVNHILDVFIAQATVQLSLAAVGFSANAVFAVGLFVIAQGYFVHANVDVRIGWLNYILASPEQHRLHHSIELSEAGHYGSDLSIWDLAFGSFTWHPGRKPVAVGLHDPESFPKTDAIIATLVHPLRRSKNADSSCS